MLHTLSYCNVRRSSVVVERSHAGDRGSIPDQDRLKSLKIGSDKCTAKRSATGASVMAPLRLPL